MGQVRVPSSTAREPKEGGQADAIGRGVWDGLRGRSVCTDARRPQVESGARGPREEGSRRRVYQSEQGAPRERATLCVLNAI